MIAVMWVSLGSLATLAAIGAARFARAMWREGLPWKPRPREHTERGRLTSPLVPALAVAASFTRGLAEAAAALDATPLAEIQRQRDERGVGDLDYDAALPSMWSLLSDDTRARGIPVAELMAAVKAMEQAGEMA